MGRQRGEFPPVVVREDYAFENLSVAVGWLVVVLEESHVEAYPTLAREVEQVQRRLQLRLVHATDQVHVAQHESQTRHAVGAAQVEVLDDGAFGVRRPRVAVRVGMRVAGEQVDRAPIDAVNRIRRALRAIT